MSKCWAAQWRKVTAKEEEDADESGGDIKEHGLEAAVAERRDEAAAQERMACN
jgi:hypothetical protein